MPRYDFTEAAAGLPRWLLLPHRARRSAGKALGARTSKYACTRRNLEIVFDSAHAPDAAMGDAGGAVATSASNCYASAPGMRRVRASCFVLDKIDTLRPRSAVAIAALLCPVGMFARTVSRNAGRIAGGNGCTPARGLESAASEGLPQEGSNAAHDVSFGGHTCSSQISGRNANGRARLERVGRTPRGGILELLRSETVRLHDWKAWTLPCKQRQYEPRPLSRLARAMTSHGGSSQPEIRTGAVEANTCWSCNAPRTLPGESDPASVPMKAFFCEHCGRIQPKPPVDVDFFTLFGLPRRFFLDEQLLESRFREWQRRLHPDRFNAELRRQQGFHSSAADPQAHYAEQASALVNAAHDTLKSPPARALYLLAEHGINFESDSEDASDQRDMDPEFLEEMLALREELDRAEQGHYDFEALRARIEGSQTRLCQELDEAFASSARNEEGALRRCRDLTARLQFYHRIARALQERL
jgi:molecular chaperone HscB